MPEYVVRGHLPVQQDPEEPSCKRLRTQNGDPVQPAVHCEPNHLSACGDETLARKREEMCIRVIEGQDLPGPVQAFADLPLPAYALKALQLRGLTVPAPIQAQGIPIVLQGKDFMGFSPKGTGKTLAFLLPVLIHVRDQCQSVQGPMALVLVPTCERGVHVAEEARAISDGGQITTYCLCDSMPKGQPVEDSVKGVQILVATPSSLLDAMGTRVVCLENVTLLVLDEADRVLDTGLGPAVQRIVKTLRTDCRTVVLSATSPPEVVSLAASVCSSDRLVHIRVGEDDRTGYSHGLTLFVEACDDNGWNNRPDVKEQRLYFHLRNILTNQQRALPARVLVFVRTEAFAEELAEALRGAGFMCEALHRYQPQDTGIWPKFSNSETRVFVTTDVFNGCGPDVSHVTHVIAYDCPICVEEFVHRLGRMGRAAAGVRCVVVFYESATRQSQLAQQLISVLSKTGQGVPPELHAIANGTSTGKWRAGAEGERAGRGVDRGPGVGTVCDSSPPAALLEYATKVLPPRTAVRDGRGACRVALQAALGSPWRHAGDPGTTFRWNSAQPSDEMEAFKRRYRRTVQSALRRYMADNEIPLSIRTALDVSHFAGVPRSGSTFWFSLGGGLCEISLTECIDQPAIC